MKDGNFICGNKDCLKEYIGKVVAGKNLVEVKAFVKRVDSAKTATTADLISEQMVEGLRAKVEEIEKQGLTDNQKELNSMVEKPQKVRGTVFRKKYVTGYMYCSDYV